MANTYTQLYIQFVFAVKYRASLIESQWEIELHKYITGIIQNHGHKMISINGMPDHLHIFVGLHPTQSISSIMKITKVSSTDWINESRFTKGKFAWQEGYGAFSYGRSQIDRVYNYILNQKKHHEKKNFITEYKELLKAFEIDYDERYIFKDPL
ncbi:MAG: IS200/IS605 family transposase [Cyclobacteriaceae bacterium]|nr:IS200/IS605 family transposase [Cyclobacteriaceae bacterium]